jgi:hypothetical protein
VIDASGPRCPECNELLKKADKKSLKRNGGTCCWCYGNKRSVPIYRQRYECDMSAWLNSLRMDDMPLRQRVDRLTGMDLRKSELK